MLEEDIGDILGLLLEERLGMNEDTQFT